MEVKRTPIEDDFRMDNFPKLDNDLEEFIELISVESKDNKKTTFKIEEKFDNFNQEQKSKLFWKLGLSTSELEEELENTLKLFELGIIKEHEFELRKKILLDILPKDSTVYQSWTSEEQESSISNSSNSFLVVNGEKTSFNDFSSRIVLDKNPREVRVFLSSTFQDMGLERDALLKYAFPELRKFCEERGLNFVEVDLRWGITSGKKKNFMFFLFFLFYFFYF